MRAPLWVRGNLVFCHCEEHSDAAIPSLPYVIRSTFLSFSLSLSFLRKQESIPLSLRARIYQGAAISFPFIFKYSLFFRHKYYKKTIIFINITIFTIEKIFTQNAVTLINKGFEGFIKTLIYCVYREILPCPL